MKPRSARASRASTRSTIPGLVDRPADLAAAVADARALIVRNRTLVGPALLEGAPKLQCVGRLGVGLDNIDLAACKARGIAVYPATGANDIAVAEYVVATAMMLLRGAYASTADVIAGAWPRNRLMGHEISGKRLGLIGFGSIARETAKRAAALDMAVTANDPFVPPEHPAWNQPTGRVVRLDLDELIATADVISLHVPLTPSTRNLVDGADARPHETGRDPDQRGARRRRRRGSGLRGSAERAARRGGARRLRGGAALGCPGCRSLRAARASS